KPTAVIIEMDGEHARKECLGARSEVAGATRELAQWLLDHPQYTAAQVARGVGCGETKIKQLRRWAQSGFSDEKHPTPVRRGYEDNRDRRREAERPRTGPGCASGRAVRHRGRAVDLEGPTRRGEPVPCRRWTDRHRVHDGSIKR